MARLNFECFYCGHRFVKYLYTTEDADGICCPSCGDIRLKDESQTLESSDPFGYTYDERTGKKR